MLVASLLCVLTDSASGATGRYWKNGDGDWTDKSHWDGGKWPAAGEVAYWNESVSATVNVNTNAVTGYWAIRARGDAATEVKTVKWIGNGSITNTSTSTTFVGNYRRLVIDGPDVYVKKSLYVYTSHAALELLSGRLYSVNGTTVQDGSSLLIGGGTFTSSLTVNSNATFSVTGGVASISSLSADSNATVSLSGGTLSLKAAPTLPEKAFNFTGGCLRWVNTSNINNDNAYLLPPAGAVFEHRSSGTTIYVTKDGTIDFDGTFVATNRATGNPSVYIYKTGHSFTGDGTFLVDRIVMRDGHTATFNVKSVKLGTGFRAETSNYTTFSFPSGIEFGAWDDWDNSGATYSPNIHLAGGVSFDTCDCIDGSTPRSIRLRKCSDNGMTSLSAKGGGAVSLDFPSGLKGLDALAVETGATLYLTNMAANVSVTNLVLKSGGHLVLSTSLSDCESMQVAPSSYTEFEPILTAASLDGVLPLVPQDVLYRVDEEPDGRFTLSVMGVKPGILLLVQ